MRIVQALGRPRYWFGPVTGDPLVLLPCCGGSECTPGLTVRTMHCERLMI